MNNEQVSGYLSQPFEDGLSARALLASIRRHLMIVVAFTLLFAAAGILVSLGQPAWYQAEGVLVIPAVPQRTAELQELPDSSPDQDSIQSQVDILQSRSVIEPVVRSLKLWNAPEFGKIDSWSWNTVKVRLSRKWRSLWGLANDPKDSPSEQLITGAQPSDTNSLSQAEIDGIVGTYAGYLTVTNDGHSMTLHVSYRALSPEHAAAVVNAHMDSYRNVEVKTKVAAAEHANAALRSQVADLQEKLQVAEAAIARYRAEHGLTGAAMDTGGVSSQLASLNSQLLAARADLAETQARAAEIGAGTGGDTVPEVVSSGTISGLRGQEAQLEGQEAELSRYHGDEYPALQRVRASLQSLRSQIARQTARERAAALQMVQRSRTREVSLEKSIAALTTQLNSADAGLQQLQGKAESIRSLLLNLEKRAAETAANPALITPNSIIASSANASATSTSSKTKPLALGGGFVGFTIGSLLSLLLELRDKGFRTSTQVQQHVGSLTVSATPRAVGRHRRAPADIILDNPQSVFAEALRVSWANIQLAIDRPRSTAPRERRPGIAIGITSAVNGEGKSVHALALARAAALAGEDVVLVDADLRHCGVSRLLDKNFRFTLKDFLQERCTAEDAIAVEKRSGVHFVPGVPIGTALTSQALGRFFNLIQHLKQRFAIIIIDFSPILGLAETIRLAMAADGLALVIRWGRTERQSVQFALDTLRTASISTIGVILNDIDLKALRRRGYRDHTAIYTERLYRVEPGYREPVTPATLPAQTADPNAPSETSRPGSQPEEAAAREQYPAASTIEKWYNTHHGE